MFFSDDDEKDKEEEKNDDDGDVHDDGREDVVQIYTSACHLNIYC